MRVRKVTDIPSSPHWAIVTLREVTRMESDYEGPGNSTYKTIETEMEIFTDEESWKSVIKERMLKNHASSSQEEFTAFHVDKVATLKLTPVVEIN